MESNPLAERANAVTVTSEDLLRVLERAEKVRHGPEAVMFVTVGLFSDDPEKAVAVLARVLALARLVSGDCLKGWISRDDSTEEIFTEQIVLSVAAEQPLIEAGDELVFEEEQFWLRVLELSEPRTIA